MRLQRPTIGLAFQALEGGLDKQAYVAQQLDRDRADLASKEAADVAGEAAARASSDTALNSQIGQQLAAVRGLNGYTSIADSSTVLATGTSAALTLADWFMTVRNVRAFGAHAKTDLGCDGTGTTWVGVPSVLPCTNFDSTAAIQAAFDKVKAEGGGTVLFPPNAVFRATAQVSFLNTQGVRIVGMASSGQYTGGSVIEYVGTQSPFIRVYGVSDFAMRDLTVRYTNPAFTGTLVATPMSSVVAIDHSALMGVGASNAQYLLDLNQTTEIGIAGSHFYNAAYAIRGQDSTGAGWANVVQIRQARFGGLTTGTILNPAIAWSITGCSFEPNADLTGRAIVMPDAAALARGLSISGSYFDDATGLIATYSWIQFRGYGLDVRGNHFNGTGVFTDTQPKAIEIAAASSGITVKGNNFQSLGCAIDVGTGLASQVDVAGNRFGPMSHQTCGTPTEPLAFQFPVQAPSFAGLLLGNVSVPALSRATDLNSAGMGWSYYDTPTNAPPAPSTGYGSIFVWSKNGTTTPAAGNWIWQVAHDTDGAHVFIRTNVNNSWNAWKTISGS